MPSSVSLIKCGSYQDLKPHLLRALEYIDCLEIFRGKRVLLKVNLMKGAPPGQVLNTHPEFLRAVIQIVKERGGMPFVGDSSGIIGFTGEAFTLSGIERVCAEEEAELLNFDSCKIIKHRMNGKVLGSIWIPEDVLAVDVRLTLPKLKTHTLTTLTGAVKNQVGLLPGGTKARLHRSASSVRRLVEAIIDINLGITFDLAIMDGILGLEGGGAVKRNPKKCNVLLASKDLVALDAVASSLIGLNPASVLTNVLGDKRGLGVSHLSEIEVLGDTIERCRVRFKAPRLEFKKVPLFSRFVYGLRERAFKPVFTEKQCTKCESRECLSYCPTNAIRFDPHLFLREDCIYCFSCKENCPYGAVRAEGVWYLKPLLRRKAEGIRID